MNELSEIERTFKKKRNKVKKQKRELDEINFRSSKERKKVRDGIDREYRSYKRSERQTVKKYIEEQIDSKEEN
jgi:hypothetical protein